MELVEYDPRWPEVFAAERAKISSAIGDVALDIQHVGSTSIPHMPAKPVIDITIAVQKISHIENASPKLEPLGYVYLGEHGIPDRHFFKRDIAGKRRFHLHCVVPQSDPWWEYVPFRDYLIAHPHVAREYEALKRQLAAKYKHDRLTYTNSKADFIVGVLKKAREAYS